MLFRLFGFFYLFLFTSMALTQDAPVYLSANAMSIATGQPSLVMMSNGSTHVPVWSLSGNTVGQSVAGVVPAFSDNCGGVKVEIVVISTNMEANSQLEDVYRVHLSQLTPDAPFTSCHVIGDPVRASLPVGALHTRTIILESFYPVKPNLPLVVRIQREPKDSASTFTQPTGLALVKVTPLAVPPDPYIVQDVNGYNSWPMMQSIGEKLVCVYSRGKAHTINSGERGVYARTSTDRGKTWTPETLISHMPDYGEVAIGKGLDSTGAMLLWVRRIGKEWNHDLYRTTDGENFTLVTTVRPEVMPIQITDIFVVPTVGLMSLWFAGKYDDNGSSHSWGTLTSDDGGKTWRQNVIESELPKIQWPTEQSAVYLGDGRIFAIARTEMGQGHAQFQLVSTDYGTTWTRSQTNISDVLASTPSLIFDAETGLMSNYYYHRGRGVLRRRVVTPDEVFEHPLRWPVSEAVALGSAETFDAGNVNATRIAGTHYLTFYSGKAPNTAVLVSEVPAPTNEKTADSNNQNDPILKE
jgi:hypothetical protein